MAFMLVAVLVSLGGVALAVRETTRWRAAEQQLVALLSPMLREHQDMVALVMKNPTPHPAALREGEVLIREAAASLDQSDKQLALMALNQRSDRGRTGFVVKLVSKGASSWYIPPKHSA